MGLWKRAPAHGRALAFILGQAILLTAPLFAHLDRFIIGRFPTTDKYGSLAFYLDGVHRRLLLDPAGSLTDPAARLIGVHMGHLWVTEFFDLFMTPEGAMNLQGFLYPVLAWASAALLFRTLGAKPGVSILMAFPYGMGLHLFRDLNCYTVEKAAVFWLPLFVMSLYKSHTEGARWPLVTGLLYLVMSWMNLYMGAVGAALAALLTLPLWGLGATALFRMRISTLPSALRALCYCVLFSLPLLAWQHSLSSGPTALGSPDAFRLRAELDSVSLWPPTWNRMSWWAAMSPVGLGIAAAGGWTTRRDPLIRTAAIAIAGLTALSLGPWVGALINPADWLARELIPGFWRAAEPESFFHGSWLLILAVGAVALSRLALPRWGAGALYLVMVSGWIFTVRGHPEFPSMSHKVDIQLADGWAERAFQTPAEGSD
jgi:hypothetical protein